jgi:hypothetical protein
VTPSSDGVRIIIISPTYGCGIVSRMAQGQVTRAVRPPVRPATRWIRVVASASARRIAGRRMARRRASRDVTAPAGPSSQALLLPA